jgi:hypothetical protein
MLTLLSDRTEEVARFRADPWPFQHTFQTPSKELHRFVSTFLAPFSLDKGSLSTDEVVFDPQVLLELMANNSIKVGNHWKWNLGVEGDQGVAELLESALSDPVDFVFVPTPELFAIYADHDGYITFYAPNEITLLKLISDLESAGFESVEYTRGSSEGRWR